MEYIIQEHSLPTCFCLNITDDCNLACKYCFVQQKPHYMSLETGKDAIDYIMSNHKKKEEFFPQAEDLGIPNVSFFGGEPSLLFDSLIIPLVLYAEEKYPNQITFDITTNGTLLNEERLKFLKSHNMHLLLSIDGDEKTQNYNRPCKNGAPSFPLIEKNIPLILKYFPETTFRATINQDTCDSLFDSYIFAIKKGFKHIFFCPNARDTWTEENKQKLKKEVEKIFTYITFSFMNNEMPIQCSPIDTTFQKILKHDLQIFYKENEILNPNRYPFRCGLGTTSASIGYDGKIFACQEQDSRDTRDYFYIGNIYDGIDIQKHSQILNDYTAAKQIFCENKSLCEHCKLRNTCVEDFCPSVSHDKFNDFFIRPEIDCVFAQYLMDTAIICMNLLVNYENSSLFSKYLEEIYSPYLKEKEEK